VLKTMDGSDALLGRVTAGALASALAVLLSACGGAPPATDNAADQKLAKAADEPSAKPAAAPVKPADAAKPAPDARPAPTTGDQWKQRLNVVEKDLSVDQQGREVMSQRLVEEALALKREFKYTLALDTVRRALQLSPAHPEARKLEMELGTLLDQYPSKEKVVGEWVRNELGIRIQQLETEIDNHVEKGKRYLADRQYTEAVAEFNRAEEKLDSIPYEVALKQRLPEVRSLIRKAKDSQSEDQLRIEAENREKAIKEAGDEESRRKNQIVESVRVLLRKAVENFENKNFDRCAELCDEILIIDPHYRAAVDLREHAYKARHKENYADYLTQRITEWKRVLNEDQENIIPYADTLRFPDPHTWSRISKRLSALSAVKEDVAQDPDILAIKNKLDNLKIQLDFQDAGLEDVVEFIRQFSGVSIVIDQAVRGDTAIMEKKISFKVKELVLANVMKLLLSQYSLAYTFKEKVLFITKPEGIGGESVLGLHDVRDLLVKVSDNPGPVIELRPPSAAAGGLTGATFTLEEPKTPGIGEEQIVKLVTDNVHPGTWEAGGHSISLTPNQQLLVNHAPETHRDVRAFLGKLRQYAGSMVSIETRFIAAHDNFLEDVGVDIRGLQDTPGPVTSGAGAQVSTSASATTPATVVDFNDRTGQNEPGFITNESARAENYDLRFRSIGTFLADLGPAEIGRAHV
jgi:tetratricopeptide (TPR) repeat protein